MTARRDRLVLALLLTGQFVLVSSQSEQRRATLAEELLARLLAPAAAAVAAMQDVAGGLPGYLSSRTALAEENTRLRAELDLARNEQTRLRLLEGEHARLATALDYRLLTGSRAQVADVVYADHTSWLRTMIIRGGAGAHFEVGQPVVAVAGVVGRIVLVAGPWAKVQLLTDRAAAAGVQLARTRRQGVLRGSGSGQLTLEYLSRQADVLVGDVVQTAGIDGVYPRGLIVGVVAEVGDSGDLFHNVQVSSVVDLSAVDQVMVLDRVEIPPSLQEGLHLGDSP